MNVIVFTGPTLPPQQARGELDAVYLPPVTQGDVYRASLARPAAIGIIDGYFDQVPAVWHKELLWAMQQGVHVFGSASMGALRAAELAPFGMVGVGSIFQAYLAGELEDEDEVAIVHGPADTGFRATSEAMVNIRATLAGAESEGVIRPETRRSLERFAKALFYPARNYPDVLARAAADGVPAGELERFRAWLPCGRVDQKRADALAMLRAMREHLAAHPAPKEVSYRMETTIFWDRLVQSAGVLEGGAASGPEMVPFEALLDEVRLDPDAYHEAHRECLLRQMIVDEARRRGYVPTRETTARQAEAFRQKHGIAEHEAFERWLAERQITADQFHQWMRQEALIHSVGLELWRQARSGLPDLLRFTSGYRDLLDRALDKQRALGDAGLDETDWTDDPDALWDWYFSGLSSGHSSLSQTVLREISADENEALLRARARERLYLRGRRKGRKKL